MGSTATAWILEKSPVRIESLFGQKGDSISDLESIPIVFLIASSISEEESLKSLVASEGWRSETFESAREFLARPQTLVPSCIVLALSPELNGLEEQKAIVRERSEVPIIVISRHADVATSVQAMKAGAIDFFVRPFSDETLLLGLRATLERSRLALQCKTELSDLRKRHASLTLRQQQVMTLVVSGLLNKQTGAELGISEITVKAHRRQVMLKMKANSLPDLVRMASALGYNSSKPIALVCHTPDVLRDVKYRGAPLVKGKSNRICECRGRRRATRRAAPFLVENDLLQLGVVSEKVAN